LLSTFGFNFNLRRYIEAFEELVKGVLETPSLLAETDPRGRGLHSSTFRLDLSTFCEIRCLAVCGQ
jgi:hypothetical protein